LTRFSRLKRIFSASGADGTVFVCISAMEVHMTEQALTELVAEARITGNQSAREQAVGELATFIYLQLHQFHVDCRNEDTRGEYIVWMYPKLEGIIARFKPERASFRTYLTWVVKLSFRTYMRNRYTQEARNRAWQSEEETRIMSLEAEQETGADWNVCTSEKEARYEESQTGAGRKRIFLSDKKKEIRARKIFLLACKAGNFLDDEMIAHVAAQTGYSDNYIREKLDFIRKAGARNRDRARACVEKQNGYYIRARRCLVEMRTTESTAPRYAALEKEYLYCWRRWNALRNCRSARIRPPSNRFLAAALGISRGTIDSTLASAMQDGYDPE
jgi:hypothetical protein